MKIDKYENRNLPQVIFDDFQNAVDVEIGPEKFLIVLIHVH